jgi:hypothetical protein
MGGFLDNSTPIDQKIQHLIEPAAAGRGAAAHFRIEAPSSKLLGTRTTRKTTKDFTLSLMR